LTAVVAHAKQAFYNLVCARLQSFFLP
jgi:hypothetical protein